MKGDYGASPIYSYSTQRDPGYPDRPQGILYYDESYIHDNNNIVKLFTKEFMNASFNLSDVVSNTQMNVNTFRGHNLTLALSSIENVEKSSFKIYFKVNITIDGQEYLYQDRFASIKIFSSITLVDDLDIIETPVNFDNALQALQPPIEEVQADIPDSYVVSRNVTTKFSDIPNFIFSDARFENFDFRLKDLKRITDGTLPSRRSQDAFPTTDDNLNRKVNYDGFILDSNFNTILTNPNSWLQGGSVTSQVLPKITADNSIIDENFYEYVTPNSVVSVIQSDGNKYVLNGNTKYHQNKTYILKEGSYNLTNIPVDHPVSIINSSGNIKIESKYTELSLNISDSVNGPVIKGYEFMMPGIKYELTNITGYDIIIDKEIVKNGNSKSINTLDRLTIPFSYISQTTETASAPTEIHVGATDEVGGEIVLPEFVFNGFANTSWTFQAGGTYTITKNDTSHHFKLLAQTPTQEFVLINSKTAFVEQVTIPVSATSVEYKSETDINMTGSWSIKSDNIITKSFYVLRKSVNNKLIDFYYGDATLTVTGKRGGASLYCYYHGYMGGQDILKIGPTADNFNNIYNGNQLMSIPGTYNFLYTAETTKDKSEFDRNIYITVEPIEVLDIQIDSKLWFDEKESATRPDSYSPKLVQATRNDTPIWLVYIVYKDNIVTASQEQITAYGTISAKIPIPMFRDSREVIASDNPILTNLETDRVASEFQELFEGIMLTWTSEGSLALNGVYTNKKIFISPSAPNYTYTGVGGGNFTGTRNPKMIQEVTSDGLKVWYVEVTADKQPLNSVPKMIQENRNDKPVWYKEVPYETKEWDTTTYKARMVNDKQLTAKIIDENFRLPALKNLIAGDNVTYEFTENDVSLLKVELDVGLHMMPLICHN